MNNFGAKITSSNSINGTRSTFFVVYVRATTLPREPVVRVQIFIILHQFCILQNWWLPEVLALHRCQQCQGQSALSDLIAWASSVLEILRTWTYFFLNLKDWTLHPRRCVTVASVPSHYPPRAYWLPTISVPSRTSPFLHFFSHR